MALMSLKFHISLNVVNLKRSLDFYRILFGIEPAKCHDDYAKFELADPPVVFSLVPQPALAGGSLSKIGLRLADSAAVAQVRERVEGAGILTQSPPGDSCATEPGSKFYVADPDLNYWQIFTGDDVSCAPVTLSPVTEVAPLPPGPVVWEHFVSQPLPERIPHEDLTVDEVRLTGTFNAALDEGQRMFLLREARRVLRANGKLLVHGLVGDRPFPGSQPKLPGLAALVSRVPVQTEPLEALKTAGFVGTQFVKFSEKPWFTIDGVELREVKLTAWQPEIAPSETPLHVLYRGPFAEAADDGGNVYPRGQRVAVNRATWNLLQRGVVAEQFLFIQDVQGSTCCAASGK